MAQARTVLFSSSLPDDSGGAELLAGIQGELKAAGYCLQRSIGDEGTQAEVEQAHLQRCMEDTGIAGLILMYVGDQKNLGLMRQLRACGKPLVLVGRLPAEDADFDCVGVDNASAAYEVVMHLIAEGHRSIAHITTHEPVSAVQERLRGYRHALTAAGIKFRPELVVPHDNDWRGIAVSPELLDSLLRLPDPPTAVFAVHDWAAMLTMLTAHLSGRSIPQDFAVAGFDGLERFRQERPVLTTAEIPFGRLGVYAARMVLERLSGQMSAGVRHLLLDAPLRVRFSTQGTHQGSLVDSSAWRRHLVHHYVMTHLAEPLSVERLAAIARVGVSTLFHDFQQAECDSPMQMVHLLRLDQARWQLLHAGSDTTVSECATRCGFVHLGRFASDYRKRYHETPSATLRRAQVHRKMS